MFIARNAKASSTPFEGAEVNQRCSLQDALRSFARRRRVSAFDAIDISPLNGVKAKRFESGDKRVLQGFCLLTDSLGVVDGDPVVRTSKRKAFEHWTTLL
jgi:hypothetical protein